MSNPFARTFPIPESPTTAILKLPILAGTLALTDRRIVTVANFFVAACLLSSSFSGDVAGDLGVSMAARKAARAECGKADCDFSSAGRERDCERGLNPDGGVREGEGEVARLSSFIGAGRDPARLRPVFDDEVGVRFNWDDSL